MVALPQLIIMDGLLMPTVLPFSVFFRAGDPQSDDGEGSEGPGGSRRVQEGLQGVQEGLGGPGVDQGGSRGSRRVQRVLQ